MLAAGYESEFKTLLGKVQGRLSAVREKRGGSDTKSELRQIQIDLTQLDTILRRLQVESRGDTNKEASIASYRSELDQVKNLFTSTQGDLERNEIFGDAPRDAYDHEDRRRLEQVTSRMESSTDYLLEAQQSLADTENVALDITSELSRQRDTIHSTHEKIRETGGILGTTARILRRLKQREIQRRMLVWFIIALLVFVIVIIIYFSFGGSSKPEQKETP